MGLFKELALLPLAPLRGTVKVAEVLADEADRRLYDEDIIKRDVIHLETDAEEGRVGDVERARVEEELMERLAVARRRATEEAELAKASLPEEVVSHG